MKSIFHSRKKRAPRLEPQRRKILEAILLLIEDAKAAGDKLTQYDIVKSLFIADSEHLNAYGRPITFDNFVAMKFGPVPSESYDMLKPAYPWAERLGMASAPFQRQPAGGTSFHYVNAERAPDLRVLSRSDVAALRAARLQVKKLGFGGVRDLTHDHPAYVAAWRPNESESKAFDMDYRMLLDGRPDDGLIRELADASRHMH